MISDEELDEIEIKACVWYPASVKSNELITDTIPMLIKEIRDLKDLVEKIASNNG